MNTQQGNKYKLMEKGVLLLFLLTLSNTLFPQISDGIPLNFCGLNGTQYNPGYHPQGSNHYSNMWVTTIEDDFLSESERFFLQMRFEEDYPGHTILAPPTASYNCHGYSHSVFQGGDTCNICWYQEILSGCFVQVQTPLPESKTLKKLLFL